MTHKQVGIWLDALKSGEYFYGKRRLEAEAGSRHCALGVLSRELGFYSVVDNRKRLKYPNEVFRGNFDLETFVLRLSDESPTSSYQEVIADIEGALEEYISE